MGLSSIAQVLWAFYNLDVVDGWVQSEAVEMVLREDFERLSPAELALVVPDVL